MATLLPTIRHRCTRSHCLFHWPSTLPLFIGQFYFLKLEFFLVVWLPSSVRLYSRHGQGQYLLTQHLASVDVQGTPAPPHMMWQLSPLVVLVPTVLHCSTN